MKEPSNSRKYFFVGFFILLICSICHAQYSPTNKWRTIDTKYFQLIYPVEYEKTAQRTAWIHEKLSPIYYKFFKVKKKRKWKIVLNSKDMANGFVAAGIPRRSVWYGGILPDSYFEHSEWITSLSIHEGRHIAQFDKSFNHSVIFAHVLGGESFSAALQGGLMPPWFFEGEAVNWETRFGPRGRGRTPSFDMEFKAIVLNGDHDSYFKVVNPRRDKFYPNWYVYGYFFTTYMMKTYGNDFWDKIIERSSKFAFPTWSFQTSIIKITGKGISKHYKNMLKELKVIYEQQTNIIDHYPVEVLSPTNKRYWVNYENAGQFDNGDILVKKSGLRDLEQLVILKPEKVKGKKTKTKKLFNSRVFGSIDVEGDLAAWSYSRIDKRFNNERYFDIVLYNHSTKKTKRITKKQRLFSPAISPDRKKIAAVEYNNGDYDIVLIDLETGKKIKNLGFKNNQISSPNWSKDQQFLTYTKGTINPFRGTAIYRYHLKTGREESLVSGKELPNPSNPIFYKNHLFFTSSFSGVDTSYALNLKSREIFQVLSRHFGIYDHSLSADEKSLILNDYGGVNGFDVVRIPINPSEWLPLKKVKKKIINVTEGMDTKEEKEEVAQIWKTPASTNHYFSKKYSPSKNAFNIHSWGLMINQDIEIGRIDFHIAGADLLDTVFFRLRGGYRLFYFSQLSDAILRGQSFTIPDLWDGDFSITINKFFPVLGWTSAYIPIGKSYSIWRNVISASIPLIYAGPHGSSAFTAALSFRVDHFFNFLDKRSPETEVSPTISLAYQGVRGRWNYGSTFVYYQSVIDFSRFLVSVGFNGEIPGIFKRDKNLFNIFYEISSLNNTPPINRLPRGIFANLFTDGTNRIYPDQYTGLRYDYRLPLFYPSGGIPHFLFIQTIWMELSFDYAFLKFGNTWDSAGSLGMSGFLETSWLNIPYITTHFGISIYYIFKKPGINYSSNGDWQFIPQFRLAF